MYPAAKEGGVRVLKISSPTPAVSIVMLARNQGSTLLHAAGSVLECSKAQLIIVEPGSDDNSRELARAIAGSFPTRVELCLEPDGGLSEGLNHGLERITGEIFGFLNADDAYLPGALDFVIEWFSKNRTTDVLMGSGLIFDERTGRAKQHYAITPNKYLVALSAFGGWTIYQQGFFIRSEALRGVKFEMANNSSLDLELLGDLFLSKKLKVKSTKQLLAIFRVSATTLTGSGIGRVRDAHQTPRINQKILGRQLNAFDRAVAISLRVFKWLRSLINAIRGQF